MNVTDKEKEDRKIESEWYNNPSIITNLALGVIVLIIILSQSFAINNNMSTTDILISILNHNSVYLLVLVYFVTLKSNMGKKYFNFLNLFLILLYFITAVTSLLTVFQSFTLNTLLSLAVHLLIIVYLVHTFFRNTRVWKEFRLAKSPFNEITNEGYFYSIMVFAVILLAVNLISTTSFDGTILTLLECIYTILFSRYIFLYRSFLDRKKKDINNEGNFDKYRKKLNDFVEDNKLDEKVDVVKKKFIETKDEVVEKVSDFVEENKIDEKVDVVKNKVVKMKDEVVEKVSDFVEKNKIDEKSGSKNKVKRNSYNKKKEANK